MNHGAVWYKREPGAYLGGVQGMPMRLHAVYGVVVDLCYMHGGAVHNDPKWISGWISDLGPAAVRNAIAELISMGKLFVDCDGNLSQKRAKNEAKTREKLRENAVRNGEKGGINSGKSRRAASEIKDLTEANASSKNQADKIREDKSREEREEHPHTPFELTSMETPQKPARKRALSVSVEVADEFARVYPHYPRQVGPAKARAAWAKARRRASFEEIAEPLRAFIRATRSTPVDKIPHFASWLNRDGWMENPDHAANRNRSSTDDLRGLATIHTTDDLARLMGPQLKVIRQ